MSKTIPPIVVESRRATKKLALFTLLGALPVAAGATLISRGDSILWAQIERALTPVPNTLAGVGFDFPGGWTNDPNGNVVITDCDCPPPPVLVADVGGDGGGGGGDSDSDSC